MSKLRRTALLAFLCLVFAASVSAQSYQPADLTLVQRKIPMAQTYFDTTWNSIFKSRGYNFSAPKLTTFVNSIDTPCGHFGKNNGMYCTKDRNVYIDAEFLASLVRNAANTLHTDGDYAAIVVAAHEYGHAVAAQLNIAFPNAGQMETFDNEQVADCFAGVITRQAKRDGALEAGDFEEGVLSLEFAGDDHGSGVNTSDLISRLIFTSKGLSHGLSDNREAAFVQGYYIGPEACSAKLGPVRYPPVQKILLREQQVPNPQKYAAGSPTCSWQNSPAGNRVLNIRGAQSGAYCFLHLATAIPANVRLELDVTRETESAMQGGIYYSDGRNGSVSGDPYGYLLADLNITLFLSLKNAAVSHGMNHALRGGDRNQSHPIGRPVHLTLDIHHQGQKLYAFEFANNLLMDVSIIANPAPWLASATLGQPKDVAGIVADVGFVGSAAVSFANFSLSSLYE
jgi:predicted metalloprotease